MRDFSNPAEVEERLWDEIERSPIGMLMATGAPALRAQPPRAQPMTAFAERRSRRLWFFIRADTDVARAAAEGPSAEFIYQQRDLQACVSGQIWVQYDRMRIEKYWNAVVAAWHPAGKDDPKLTLLRMDCDEAEVWISSAGPMRFAWEIAKANALHVEPQLGGRTHLSFH